MADGEQLRTQDILPLVIVSTRPTQADVFCFYELAHELRQRNWEVGLFIDSKERLVSERRVDQLRRWLGGRWPLIRLRRFSKQHLGPGKVL